MAKDLHRGARRQELAEHAEGFNDGRVVGFADGVLAAIALLRGLGHDGAAEELERAQVVDSPEVTGK